MKDFDATVTLSAGTALLLKQEAELAAKQRAEAPPGALVLISSMARLCSFAAVSCELIVLWFAEVVVASPEAEIMVESAEATATGGSLFPTVDSVLEEEFKTLPQYLQSMFPLEVRMIELVGLNASVGCL